MNGTIDDEAFQQEEVLALTAHSSPGVSDASPPCSPPSPSRPHAGSRDSSEQAGRLRAWHQRDYGEGTPRPSDAKNAGRFSCGPRDHGRQTRVE